MHPQLGFAYIPTIGYFGAIGVAYATATSYFVQFAVRALHTRKTVKIAWNMPRLLLNIVLIVAQTAIMLMQGQYYLVASLCIFIAIFAINVKDVLVLLRQKLKRG